jgi:antitoxin (DNA-binding transcriptional repressor) of toxin-antitoxin stability system
MAKDVIHISEAEAAGNFAGVLARVRAGAEIVIEGGDPVLMVRAEPVRGRSISECIALAKAHETETGKFSVISEDFAADVEDVVGSRKLWNPPAWESSSTLVSLSPLNGHTVFGPDPKRRLEDRPANPIASAYAFQLSA